MAIKKLIVVTGATRGLGRALTGKFIALGHTVLGCGRSREQVAQLRTEFPAPQDFAVVNVGHDNEVKEWAARVLASHGAPDLLINNAALCNHAAPTWLVPANGFDAVIAVNVNGVASVIRHFVPAMVGRGRGVIVNLSSGLGRSTMANFGPYCTSKWAVEGMTRSLAQELPAGMAAIPLNPGVIDTDMLRQGFPDIAKNYPTPETWSERAAPFLLQLGPKDNGHPLEIA